MKVTFLQSGESPDFGPFKEGDERELDEATAITIIERGLAVHSEIIIPQSAIDKEVSNGK